MKKYPELNTERLILRGFQPTDAPHIQELAGAFEVAEMTLNIPHPYLDGMAETWMSSHQSEYNSGNGVVFAMIELHSGKLVGAVGLTVTKRFNRAELGYWVGKPFWEKGYATEASKALLKYGFEVIRLNKIHASHMTQNPASGRVMQKIGMESEGVLKQHALKWDQFVDLAIYGIVSTAWQAQQTQ
ncbi:MAG: GNAT family N-acetyltransferase [Candidatus Marinimicrobia bacterium]|jgi:[ribosomal protein S5]-alanine N-acetyltransferase|nr:GNAT family N-acetyltransferase [Candidatus Neomarinimicrobiota bacterium]MBT4361805.1 GNAT family N-acetyltransferase [Candidatus Neomarinimicrobiota bacterium]MBT4714439.1 GNAT family N-acetyltransferase [Candidatus Neomarinimicrobiota bacterium]MBT4946140.1 GNAT family N-acetyltransferase [Candidatus Neomarinimicrobiota bacterium]MBT5268939.1 GNAT family N-acetyltransferase [Candidatus Neomarinimicrobiota bacterium]